MEKIVQNDCNVVGDKKVFKRLSGHKIFVESCAFSPDGVFLATCSADETVQIWDSNEMFCKAVLKGHQDNVWNVNFSTEGDLLCSCSTDKTVRVWCVVEICQKHVLKGHYDTVWACKFTHDNIRLVSCSSDRSIILWDIQYEQVLMRACGHSNVVEDIEFSPNNQFLLASCSRDKKIGLWLDLLDDKHSDKKVKCKFLRGHKERVTSISFLPKDGTLLASSSADKTVRIWDIGTGVGLQVLLGHSNIIWKCTLIQVGEVQLLASCSSDRSLR